MARELDDAILMLRTNNLASGTIVLKTAGDAARVLACDAAMMTWRDDWFVRETLGMLRRTLLAESLLLCRERSDLGIERQRGFPAGFGNVY